MNRLGTDAPATNALSTNDAQPFNPLELLKEHRVLAQASSGSAQRYPLHDLPITDDQGGTAASGAIGYQSEKPLTRVGGGKGGSAAADAVNAFDDTNMPNVNQQDRGGAGESQFGTLHLRKEKMRTAEPDSDGYTNNAEAAHSKRLQNTNENAREFSQVPGALSADLGVGEERGKATGDAFKSLKKQGVAHTDRDSGDEERLSDRGSNWNHYDGQTKNWAHSLNEPAEGAISNFPAPGTSIEEGLKGAEGSGIIAKKKMSGADIEPKSSAALQNQDGGPSDNRAADRDTGIKEFLKSLHEGNRNPEMQIQDDKPQVQHFRGVPNKALSETPEQKTAIPGESVPNRVETVPEGNSLLKRHTDQSDLQTSPKQLLQGMPEKTDRN